MKCPHNQTKTHYSIIDSCSLSLILWDSGDEEELKELQKQLQETLKEIQQQQEFVNTTHDIQALRTKKLQLAEQFEAIKNQYKAEKVSLSSSLFCLDSCFFVHICCRILV